MGQEEIKRLLNYVELGTAHMNFMNAFSEQLIGQVKPYMKKVRPRILHVGGGFTFVDEAVVLATLYKHAEIDFADPDVVAIEGSLALMDDALAIPVGRAAIDLAKATQGKRVEDVQGEFDLLVWRNPPMHNLSSSTIWHMLSLGGNNAVVYFTSSETQNYRDLLDAVRSYSEPGVTIEILHPKPEEFQTTELPESPREMQMRNIGFTDLYTLSVQMHKSSRRLNS